MSDLVRRVAFRIRAEQYLKHKEEDQARAAIAAVAEWLNEEFSSQDEMIEIKAGLVAALRAAGDGR